MFPNRKARLTLEQATEVIAKVIVDAKEKFGIDIKIIEPIKEELDVEHFGLNIQTEPRFHANILEDKLDTLFKEEDHISFQLCGGTEDDGTLLGRHHVLIYDELD